MFEDGSVKKRMQKGLVNLVASSLVLCSGINAIAILPFIASSPAQAQSDEETNIRIYK